MWLLTISTLTVDYPMVAPLGNCQDNCSGHGRCIDGVCLCDEQVLRPTQSYPSIPSKHAYTFCQALLFLRDKPTRPAPFITNSPNLDLVCPALAVVLSSCVHFLLVRHDGAPSVALECHQQPAASSHHSVQRHQQIACSCTPSLTNGHQWQCNGRGRCTIDPASTSEQPCECIARHW